MVIKGANDKKVGLSRQQAADMLQRGELSNDTLVWRPGLDSWTPLNQELAKEIGFAQSKPKTSPAHAEEPAHVRWQINGEVKSSSLGAFRMYVEQGIVLDDTPVWSDNTSCTKPGIAPLRLSHAHSSAPPCRYSHAPARVELPLRVPILGLTVAGPARSQVGTATARRYPSTLSPRSRPGLTRTNIGLAWPQAGRRFRLLRARPRYLRAKPVASLPMSCSSQVSTSRMRLDAPLPRQPERKDAHSLPQARFDHTVMRARGTGMHARRDARGDAAASLPPGYALNAFAYFQVTASLAGKGRMPSRAYWNRYKRSSSAHGTHPALDGAWHEGQSMAPGERNSGDAGWPSTARQRHVASIPSAAEFGCSIFLLERLAAKNKAQTSNSRILQQTGGVRHLGQTAVAAAHNDVGAAQAVHPLPGAGHLENGERGRGLEPCIGHLPDQARRCTRRLAANRRWCCLAVRVEQRWSCTHGVEDTRARWARAIRVCGRCARRDL